MTPFTHLHVHSRYTLLGATPSVEELAARAAAEGLTHLALTDTLALYGAVAFARACRSVAVQPIIGMTLPLWSRGPDFFLWDGATWLLAKLPPKQPLPPAWEPLLITGVRQTDGWGMAWLQLETWQAES